MPITPTNISATPDSQEALMDWIDLHYGAEKATALTAAMMAWNLAAKITKQDITHTAQKCHDIALAVDSNRGNEKVIAKAILDEFNLTNPNGE